MSAASPQPAETFNRVPPRPRLARWAELLERAADLIDAGDHIVSDNMYDAAKALVDEVANGMYAAHGAAARAAWDKALERRRDQ